MTPEQFDEMNKNIETTIIRVVNGKIDKLRGEVGEYIKGDELWKEGVTPSIDLMKEMQGFASVGGFILKGLVLIGAATGAVYAFFKFLVNR